MINLDKYTYDGIDVVYESFCDHAAHQAFDGLKFPFKSALRMHRKVLASLKKVYKDECKRVGNKPIFSDGEER